MTLSQFPCRTELHFNHFAENSAFGIAPPSKVSLSKGLVRYRRTTYNQTLYWGLAKKANTLMHSQFVLCLCACSLKTSRSRRSSSLNCKQPWRCWASLRRSRKLCGSFLGPFTILELRGRQRVTELFAYFSCCPMCVFTWYLVYLVILLAISISIKHSTPFNTVNVQIFPQISYQTLWKK